MKDKFFAGKVAIVTGAAQGIGFEIAQRLHSAGAAVWITDINLEEAARAVNRIDAGTLGRIAACQVDVRQPQSVQQAVAKCVETFGRLDFLINNAGIVGRGTVEQMSPDAWSDVLDVNLTGSFLCCQAAIPRMKATGGGVILNVSSVSVRVPGIGLSAYCCSKAGLEVLTKVLAAEVAPYGIRVNAYAPGVTTTAMTRDLIEARGDEKVKQIALRRFGQAEDIAELVLFLCSERSAWITGTVISIDGGTMVVGRPWEAWPD
ncbi:MAG: SDR family oxidoreductase [Chloroflexi bacterium]|nr:SDR family oxidoreductase [Chloroflexota bacterium]